MSNKNENQNENLNKFYDTLENVIKTGRADGKQETLASTTTSQTTATTTTVGTGTIASNSNMQYGWICPKCGKVYAPWKDSCDCYLNIPIPYTPPNTPAPTPFNPMPSWPQTPEVGDAPGWWQYGPKCGEPIPCGSISSDDTVPQLQIYNTALSTANADSPDIAAIKAMGEVVSDNLYTPLKNLDKVFNDKFNLKATKNIN